MLKCDFLGNTGAQFKQLSENSDGFGLGGLLHSPRISQISTPKKSTFFLHFSKKIILKVI